MEVFEGAIDRGLEGIVACSTGISSIVDATLTYRGFNIEDLADHSTFEETTFLLWNNKLPTEMELTEFQKKLRAQQVISDPLLERLKELPTDSVHPMSWLRTAVSIAGLFDSTADDISIEGQKDKAFRLTGLMGALVAAFERIRQKQDIVKAHPDKSIAWNFLYQLKGETPDEEMVKVFDTCLVLHADHELNCSTFASRVTTSSLSDIYSAIVSAIGALKGPLHGGANEQVMRMLKKIKTVDAAKEWVTEALAQKKKIMGMGHRVYKNGDPRAKVLRKMSESLTKKVGKGHYYEMSALIDETVKEKKGLLPNVDFYSATVYYSMGIPLDLYTPIFATSRISGWLAHIMEQHTNNRIYRPRGQFVGETHRTWKDLKDR